MGFVIKNKICLNQWLLNSWAVNYQQHPGNYNILGIANLKFSSLYYSSNGAIAVFFGQTKSASTHEATPFEKQMKLPMINIESLRKKNKTAPHA